MTTPAWVEAPLEVSPEVVEIEGATLEFIDLQLELNPQ